MDNDILKSIEEDMKKQSNAFNEVNTQINTVYNEYNTKLAEIEKEGNTKIKELQNKREQIRGAYTALLNQYNKFKQETTNKESEKVEIEEKEEEQKVPKRGKKQKVQKQEGETTVKSNNTGLSKSDMEKLKQLEQYGEAPDYLKEQYK